MIQISTDNESLASNLEVTGQTVIDVGCGGGAMVRWLKSVGADVTGVECGLEALARARDSDPGNPGSYIEGEGQDLPIDDGTADVVTFFRSLHHVPEGEMVTALAEAYRVLKPGGTAYVVEPVPAGPSFEVSRLIDDETYVRGLAQEALAGATELGFSAPVTSGYVTQSVYVDTDAWELAMIGVAPDRADKVEELRPQIRERFYANGAETPDGWAFTSEQRVAILHKPS